MFDVAFSELVVIAIVALIVIGPEKLPKVARTLGALAGRMQRYVTTVKADIEREIQFEDLQKIQQEIKQSVDAAKTNLDELKSDVESQALAIEAEFSVENSIANAAAPAKLGVEAEPKSSIAPSVGDAPQAAYVHNSEQEPNK